jgi:DNA-binding response OmpR family regulator
MKTIVIIDDEFGLADVLQATLSEVGYRALTASNGVRGLEVMAESTPDLVILDYMMPLLDGPGVLRAMRREPRLAQVPVVMISAMPEAVVRSRADGYAHFLRKPFDFESLLRTVEQTVGPPPPPPT